MYSTSIPILVLSDESKNDWEDVVRMSAAKVTELRRVKILKAPTSNRVLESK
jgi:hypothetical protein